MIKKECSSCTSYIEKKYIGQRLGDYVLIKYINSGGYGHVFKAQTDNGVIKAVKISKTKKQTKNLEKEYKIYGKIKNPDYGIPESELIELSNKDKIMVMDLLGVDLDNYLKHNKINLKKVCDLAIQMLKIIKYIHKCGYIHRDIKPSNFVFGLEDKTKLYCIDFGLAKKFLNSQGELIPYKKFHHFYGTCRYASISAHKKETLSRKDDLESLGYMLIYLLKGKLPWQNIVIKKSEEEEENSKYIYCKNKDEKYKLVMNQKMEITEEMLCKGLPKQFIVYLKYVKYLDYNEKPLYDSLINMFIKLSKTL